jgi:hypothetical protein
VKIVSSGQAECMFLSKILGTRFDVARRFSLWHPFSVSFLIVWGEIGGGVCLYTSQLNQNLLPTIEFLTTQRGKFTR